MQRATFSIRLTHEERERVQQLARETGRAPANVLRLLLSVTDLPEVRRRLGLPDAQGQIAQAEATQ